MPEQQLPFHHAKKCYRQRLWETGEGANACIVIAGFKIPVHAPVLEEESSYFQSQFRRSFQESGRLEFHFDIENVNTVWRILELVYLGTYSNKLYPLSCLSGLVPTFLRVRDHTNRCHRRGKWAFATWVDIPLGGVLGFIEQSSGNHLSQI